MLENFPGTLRIFSRLARSGKIDGKRIGHSWFIDKDSLTNFLDQQGNRKIDYARALARAREAEYREHHSFRHNVKETFTNPIDVSRTNVRETILRTHAFALFVACAVIAFGVCITNAATLPWIEYQTIAIAGETAFGFNAAFGNIPSDIAIKIKTASANIQTFSPHVASHVAFSYAPITSLFSLNSNFVAPHSFALTRSTSYAHYSIQPSHRPHRFTHRRSRSQMQRRLCIVRMYFSRHLRTSQVRLAMRIARSVRIRIMLSSRHSLSINCSSPNSVCKRSRSR